MRALHAISLTLSQHAITTSPLHIDAPTGPSIICFSTITPQLCDFVREVSRNGVTRALTVAVPGSCVEKQAVWALLQAGAADVIKWDAVANPGGIIAARLDRWRVVDELVASPLVRSTLVGQSPAWLRVLRQIVEVARFTDATVLVMGETGTGKELVARLIHALDPRPEKPDLVLLDCTTVVPELSGSEFFGHERGAFTNAVAPRDGAFALADGGTLFLDEVGELPLGLQAQLLRVIQEQTYKRVGSNTWRRARFRLVCATNRNLLHEEQQGNFRRDLYYRIATWSCSLPPLRERRADIIPLVQHFMRILRSDQEVPELDDAVCSYLLARDYPGNIRDLRQLVLRIMCRHIGCGPITIGDIPEDERPDSSVSEDWWDSRVEDMLRRALALGFGLKEIRNVVDEAVVQMVIRDEQGNLQRAARKLGVTDRALQLRRASRKQLLDGQSELENLN
ncbi:MAG: sigma-54-dependent Fis family transcriptional regulator [Chloroflexi bacterium]|nr:MAG: sigma-54-dependent Fis family transcriptional regulator [Chloroflexota bacterium]